MSYLKDREIWLSSVPTGNPPAGYVWVFIQNGVFVVRDSNGVDKIMATTTGTVTNATSASYVEYSNVANKPALISGSSQVSYTGLSDIPAGIVSGSTQVSFNGIVDKPTLVSSSAQIVGYNVFATTGSNQFDGSQAITGSLTITGQVVAQTLNVQQVTSSIVYSSGSNIFGNDLGNTQQFTGSMFITGSNLNANVGSACFQGSVCSTTALATHIISNSTLSIAGNCSSAICLIKDYSGIPGNPGLVIYNTAGNLTFQHNSNGGSTITGGNLLVSGVGCFSGTLCSPTGLFSGCVGIGNTSPSEKLTVDGNILLGGDYNLAIDVTTNGNGKVGRTDRAYLQINRSNFEGFLSFHTTSTGAGGLSERMRINSTGAATFSCSVTSNGAKPQLCVNGDSGHGAGIHLNTSLSGVNRRNWAIFTEENVDGDFVIKSSTCTGGSPNSGNTRFAILNNGNVGINTTNPNARLQVGDGTQAGLNGAGNKIHIASNTSGGRSALLTLANSSGGTTVEGQFESSAESADLRVIIGSTSNHPVVFRASNTEYMRITSGGNVGIGCISPGVSLTIGGTDAIKIPVGTTAQRPSPSTGMVRFNSSCTELEYYNGSEWLFFTSTPTTQGYYADVLVVAGGGGGGGAEASNGFGGGGAGGGAGGYIAGRIFINYDTNSYPITIGAGGSGGLSYSQGSGSGCNGSPGNVSCALGLAAIGGGFGAGDETGTGGGNGGSGGGTGGDNIGTFGKSVLGQGCNGGDKNTRNGGGGGGASQNGFTGYTESGNGGNGRTWLNGTTYAGGGGGGAGAAVQTTSSGGSGGGGNGSSTNGTAGDFQPGGTATAGCANTGGGGGGAAAGRAQGGQNGGSGIVIIRYFGSQKGFGGSITSSGGYTYHTFTTSGTYCATYYA